MFVLRGSGISSGKTCKNCDKINSRSNFNLDSLSGSIFLSPRICTAQKRIFYFNENNTSCLKSNNSLWHLLVWAFITAATVALSQWNNLHLLDKIGAKITVASTIGKNSNSEIWNSHHSLGYENTIHLEPHTAAPAVCEASECKCNSSMVHVLLGRNSV